MLELFLAGVGSTFSSHRQSSTGSVVVTATCATSPPSQITSQTQKTRQPGEQESIEHKMTHLPFRSWCRHCVSRKRKKEDCRRKTAKERNVPESHVDYMVMGTASLLFAFAFTPII